MILGLWLGLAMLVAGCGNSEEETGGSGVGGDSIAAGPAGEPFEATFTIANGPDSVARVIGTIGSTNFLVDSIKPVNGVYHVKLDTALPGGVYFLSVAYNFAYQFLLDQDQTFTLTSDFRDPIRTAKVEGSLDNELLYQNLKWEQDFQARLQPVDQQFNALPSTDPNKAVLENQIKGLIAERKAHLQSFKDQHPNSFFTVFKMAGQNPELHDVRLPDGSFDEQLRIYFYRNEYWDNTPLDDMRILRSPIIVNKLKTYMTQITPQVHDSLVKYADILIAKTRGNKEVFKFVVNWIAIEHRTPKQMGLESVFVHVVDKYFTDDQAFWSTPEELKAVRKDADEMRPSLLGKIGQNLECTNTAGKPESLYSLKGPVTLLFIWNYECEHCQEETPKLKEIYDRYHGKGLEVYSLCTGTEEKLWRDFLAKYKIQGFHNVWDPQYKSNYYQKYHIDITPELYVLDRNHKIVAKDLKPEQLPPVLDPLF
jgi:thiol-disulfide isomerase/thioredoxin